MQRKNYILRTNFKGKRAGIAMIMAIIVVVVISTIMVLSLILTSETTKKTADLYLYEQAVLYSRSAAELALLEIANNGCQNSFNQVLGNAGEIQYDANISMQYIYTGPATNIAGTACTPYNPTSPLYITTPEQNGSVLMDITITLHDSSIANEPITYFRRTIQKL
ncbi:hypothetical protein [Sulfurimonas sp.]|uniref:hypothetical protein n=1 Tax=Sulfurimonas sp. TaxID=2022749 RepID=UPI00261574B9|nr:hypothetical protein [Sulfurimonas sp.]MDD5158067.1 hypothetical protein [Sulfurimonas sp.]